MHGTRLRQLDLEMTVDDLLKIVGNSVSNVQIAFISSDVLELMRNLYIYNVCMYISSILSTGVDGAAGGQILSPRLFIPH